MSTYLLLSIAHLLPLGTEELADLTERGFGVLLLDSLSVVLDKEHVGGKGSVLSAGLVVLGEETYRLGLRGSFLGLTVLVVLPSLVAALGIVCRLAAVYAGAHGWV